MSSNDWHLDGATRTAAEIRRGLRAAIKDGTLPAGCTVSVRKRTASMMTAVDVYLTTPNPRAYYDPDKPGYTPAGGDLVRLLDGYVCPHRHKVDNYMSFLHAHLDGRGIPTGVGAENCGRVLR